MNKCCPHCGEELPEPVHWNPSSMLSLVGVPVYIQVDNKDILVLRRNWVCASNQTLEYQEIGTDKIIRGKYPWRIA